MLGGNAKRLRSSVRSSVGYVWLLLKDWPHPNAQIAPTTWALCFILLEKLSLEYLKDDSADIMQLCTLVVTGVVTTGYPAQVIYLEVLVIAC